MAELFGRNQSVISRHITNIFKEDELDEKNNMHFLHITNADRPAAFYNLDVIISVGYRVNSKQGIRFRQWANRVLKDYLLRGIAINQRIEKLEHKMIEFDLFLKTSHQQNESLLKNEIAKLKDYIEAILADFNDINEDTRMQLELICRELAELQTRNKWIGLN